jgi:hypothetical protein
MTLPFAWTRPSARAVELPGWARSAVADVDLAQLQELVVSADVQLAFPGYARDEAFLDRLRASVAENLACLRDVLLGRQEIDDIAVDKPLQFGEVQAELGITQSCLHRSYRVGFLQMWQSFSQAVAEQAMREGVDAAEAIGAANILSRAIMDYQAEVASLVAQAYTRVEENQKQSRDRLRHRLVCELLRR